MWTEKTPPTLCEQDPNGNKSRATGGATAGVETTDCGTEGMEGTEGTEKTEETEETKEGVTA